MIASLETSLDPVTLEILWTRIISTVDEAAKVIKRSSFSTLSNEANDFACVLTDAAGRSLAQNTGSIPSFIGTLPATVRHFFLSLGRSEMAEGDVLITNNPWQGTGHLNDITVVRPIFKSGQLVAFAATTSHVPDIGGKIRSVEPREIFEEGFHIPLMHFIRAGVPDKSLIALLETNVRTPEQTLGDVWAQVGALEMMEERTLALMQDYGLDTLETFANEIFDRSEKAMRHAIAAVPDGRYEYRLLTDGLDEPLSFKIALTVDGEAIRADYTGTSPQQPRAINCVLAYTFAMTCYAIKCALLPDLPNNEGILRAIEVDAPSGSILNPAFPAAVGGRAATGHYVPALVFGALHAIVPDLVAAAPGSPLWILTLSGVRQDGRPYATVLFHNGGTGGRANGDGMNCLSFPSNISATPVELVEHNGPLFIHHRRLAEGSGGLGEHRGGLGQDVEIESLSDSEVAAFLVTERTRFGAPGLGGGEEGARGRVEINGQPVNTRVQHILRKGDRLSLVTPGGGGFGDASRRSAADVERDAIGSYA